ncbi:MAG TPA: AI-2E family transporter, partial [Anaerolineae bacterium]|nr:AI-2E family transporter [Anaerolineae bacterium]HIQ05366.1 AI-2E family transporter [Anaerolineae bacterium]
MEQLGLTPARRNRLILVLALLTIVGGILWAARAALFPYLLALFLAYLLVPVVNFLDDRMPPLLRRLRLARPLAILFVYLLAAGVVAGVIAFLVPPVVNQISGLIKVMPRLYEQARDHAQEWFRWYQSLQVSPQLEESIQRNLQEAAAATINAVQRGLVHTITAVTSTVSFLLGMVVIPFFLFYILN